MRRTRQTSNEWDRTAAAESREAFEIPIGDHALSQDVEQSVGVVAAVSGCPVPECSSLVIEYRQVRSVRTGHPEDWVFTCHSCGTEFAIVQGDLTFQTVPKQWLSAETHAA